MNCKKLQFVVIPKKVTSIGGKAFAGCKKLNGMVVKSKKIEWVGTDAFWGTASKIIVKTSRNRQKQYSKLFRKTGGLSQKAQFVADPVKIKYKGKAY